MGLDALRNIASMDGQPPGAPRKILDLVPGNRLENFEEIHNLRLEYDGPYLRLKRRGGTTLQRTFFGSINTLYPFSARANNVLKDYIAVHNTAGDIILWNVTDDTTATVMTGFPTSEKIQMAHSRIFLYAFSYDAGIAKYHDLETGGEFTYLNYNKTYISLVNYLHDNLEEQNILGFAKGEQVIVFPNVPPGSGSEIINSSTGDGQLDPNQYGVQSFRYTYNGGKFLVDQAGNEYKRSQVIGFTEGSPPLQYTVGGSGANFTIDIAYYPLNANGEVAYESYVATLLSVTEAGGAIAGTLGYLGGHDPVGVSWSSQLGGVDPADIENQNTVIPYSPDLEPLVGQPSNKDLTNDGITTTTNGQYEEPKIYRQYVFVDQLNDGSVSIPGKPFQVEVGVSELHETGVAKVRFTVNAGSAQVARRFLCCTRWQPTKQKAFDPSTPEYPNSPLFIAREVDPDRTLVEDSTPDDKLFRPILEQLRIAGGIADIFGSGELAPLSVAQFGGSLLHGGYQVNRPVPDFYTNPATATIQNIFVNITQTTQLANDMALAFQFEYTDGKRSDIIETEQFLQEGNTIEEQPVACDQTRASGSHQVTQGAQVDGDVEIEYLGISVIASLDTLNHASADNAAEAIRQAVQASVSIRISAAINMGSTIVYTEKRWGEEFNGNQVNITQIKEASQGHIEVSANNLAASPSEGWLDVDANNLAASASENHQITVGADTTAAITINDTDTLEQIVDKYVAEINGDANISPNWTASKIDNGDGTWRCLIQSDVNNESENGTTIAISGDTDVTVVVQSPTSGGSDGTESHTITVGPNTTAAITINAADTPEQIVDKYVAEINGDANISPNWTASKVDQGGGTWRCVIISDTPGAADNGTAIDVTEAGIAGGSSDVALTISTPTAGGSDGPGLTFDTEDPTISGAEEPEGTKAEGYIAVTGNNQTSGETSGQIGEVDSNQTDEFIVTGDDSLLDAVTKLYNALINTPAITSDWDIDPPDPNYEISGVNYPGVTIRAKIGGVSFNDIVFKASPTSDFSVEWQHSSPGQPWTAVQGSTSGGAEGCQQSSASVDVSANGLAGSATEDHTITVDGNSTAPITINDTDTTQDIVDKYIAEIQNTPAIDIEWKATKSDQGGGTWRLVLTYRQYGTVGDGRAVSVAGDVDVTVTENSPSAGGDDGGTVPVGSATEVNANRMQIHSLNTLVSKVFVLGRTVNESTNFHLIKEVLISDPEAHGMIIELPNTTEQLDEIENTTHPVPSATDIRTQVTFQNFINVGTPFQEFPISGQKSILDQSEILRAIPLSFDVDKTQMRYKFLLVTDKNLQLAYLVDTGAGFDKDIELFFEGIRIKQGTRAGITLVENNRVIMHTEDGIKLFDQNQVRKLLDDREYDIVKNNPLKTAILNRTHNEYWFIFEDQTVLVWDLTNEKAVKTFSFGGPGIGSSVREGVYAHNNMVLAIGGQLCYTDLEGIHDDLGQGVSESHYINAFMQTRHLGQPNIQTKILEVDVAGQTYNVQVLLDLEKERLESNTGSWNKNFNADESSTVESLDISGTSFQFHKRAIMPKIKIDLTGNGDGFISHATLKYLEFENRGKARQ